MASMRPGRFHPGNALDALEDVVGVQAVLQ